MPLWPRAGPAGGHAGAERRRRVRRRRRRLRVLRAAGDAPEGRERGDLDPPQRWRSWRAFRRRCRAAAPAAAAAGTAAATVTEGGRRCPPLASRLTRPSDWRARSCAGAGGGGWQRLRARGERWGAGRWRAPPLWRVVPANAFRRVPVDGGVGSTGLAATSRDENSRRGEGGAPSPALGAVDVGPDPAVASSPLADASWAPVDGGVGSTGLAAGLAAASRGEHGGGGQWTWGRTPCGCEASREPSRHVCARARDSYF